MRLTHIIGDGKATLHSLKSSTITKQTVHVCVFLLQLDVLLMFRRKYRQILIIVITISSNCYDCLVPHEHIRTNFLGPAGYNPYAKEERNSTSLAMSSPIAPLLAIPYPIA